MFVYDSVSEGKVTKKFSASKAFGLLFSACGGMAVVCLLPGGWLAPAADTSQSGETAPAPARMLFCLYLQHF